MTFRSWCSKKLFFIVDHFRRMGDYFFMSFIISESTISISNKIIYSINNTPFIEVSEQSPPFLAYDYIIYTKREQVKKMFTQNVKKFLTNKN